MKDKSNIEKKVAETMAAMEQMEHLEAGPYFYSRVEARIRDLEGEGKSSLVQLFGIRVFQPALLALLIIVNIVTALFVFVETGKTGDTVKTSLQGENKPAYAEIFAAEYALTEASQTIDDYLIETFSDGETK